MRYAGLIKNDIAAGPGICTTFFTQGCPHHCSGCHNPETWDFEGGKEFTPEVINEIVEALTAQGIERKLCIMGGEPLCPQNEFLTMLVIIEIRERLPEVPIYLWTGYTVDELQHRSSKHLKEILNSINYLIDGPYVKELRDTTLPMRGSSNQRVIDMQAFDFSEKI
jgi:anaerobic ribonucleoside-triphosphate reductase activating protein